jgi:hypothetical protein
MDMLDPTRIRSKSADADGKGEKEKKKKKMRKRRRPGQPTASRRPLCMTSTPIAASVAEAKTKKMELPKRDKDAKIWFPNPAFRRGCEEQEGVRNGLTD